MTTVFRLLLTAVFGFFVLAGAKFLRASANADQTPELAAGVELFGTGTDHGATKGVLRGHGAKVALGSNANAVLSLDLIADGGAGNQRDDGVTTGNVSGRGTKIALEIFATGVATSLRGVILRFDFDASLVSFAKAENSAFALSVPEASVGVNLAALSPVTLAPSGFLARAEFETVADVSGREFSIGIESVTLAESSTSSDVLRTSSEISFNSAGPSPDFDGDGTVGFSDFLAFAASFGSSQGGARYETQFDLDGNGSVGFSDFLIFAGAFGSQVPPSGGGGGGGTTPPSGNPDLIVESPSVDDNTLTTGQSFRLSARVRNQGNAAAAATTLRYYRSSNATISTDDTQVGTDAVSSLAAGTSSDVSVSLNAPSDAGTFYYGACVDNVSGESDTRNNCSGGVSVTVARVSSGFAPADQATFNSLVVGKRIEAESYFLDFESAGRVSEGFRRHSGSYTYSNTGANAGTLTQDYDEGLFGGRCTYKLTFTSTTTGTARWACDDGQTGETEDWRLSDLSTPIFARATADTLYFGFLDTFPAGQTRAYDLQVRVKTPQGRWHDECETLTNSSDAPITTYASAWFSSPDLLEPNTTYEFRYRYRNSSSCDTGSPDPWSPIAEGMTRSGGTGGGGGGTSNLGACRAGLVVRPNQNCTVSGGSFRNIGGGCFNYTPLGSAMICSGSFNLNGFQGTRVGDDFRITAVP